MNDEVQKSVLDYLRTVNATFLDMLNRVAALERTMENEKRTTAATITSARAPVAEMAEAASVAAAPSFVMKTPIEIAVLADHLDEIACALCRPGYTPGALMVPNSAIIKTVEAAHSIRALLAENAKLRAALAESASRFQFYANEHTKAGEHKKAATDQKFANAARGAIGT